MPITDKGEMPTPETDKAIGECLYMEVPPRCVVDADFARSLETQRDEARNKLTAQMLFCQLGGRLITRIMEAADMSLSDATDVELQLVRMLSELATLRRQSAALQEALKEIRELVGLHMLVHGGACADFAPTVHSKADSALRSTATK